ncbi:hypothetical protein QJS10_CPA01g00547 [Acorus calamus]|uniref:Uncharacterized protein n=1 Tax=Acorus calamus TaxID=4465 RepID=A0AAV9FJ08_ACOCL|nr:hypothetical protein QJS10_CPA01g00547 [Acorus calamus]
MNCSNETLAVDASRTKTTTKSRDKKRTRAATPSVEDGGGGGVGNYDDDGPRRPENRIFGPPTKPRKLEPTSWLLHEHRGRLMRLLRGLTRGHAWREASGVLSVLLRGTPNGVSMTANRRMYVAAMELRSRLGMGQGFNTKIKNTYEVWMTKNSYMKKRPKKKYLVQLEYALFHYKQGNIEEALTSTRLLVQDHEAAMDPMVNLIHGLILYQLWYNNLPEEMQLKEFDIPIPEGPSGMAISGGSSVKQELVDNLDEHDTTRTRVKVSSDCISDTSVRNDKKVLTESEVNPWGKHSHRDLSTQDFYLNESVEKEEGKATSNNYKQLDGVSIFSAHGLDRSLLPVRSEEFECSIDLHGRMGYEHYTDSMKHLRAALYTNPPLMAALLPLIQLLLLGDRVAEACVELEKICLISNTALPFRLKASIMESVANSQFDVISKCYENVLLKDPLCSHSLSRLIKMHKSGTYSTKALLEMIALHLDATCGACDAWEELCMCFLKLQNMVMRDKCGEDLLSTNVKTVVNESNPMPTGSSNAIPDVFMGQEARISWDLRCKWWHTRHFSSNVYLSEKQAGEWELLTYKAACASHLYGPKFEFVTSALNSLVDEKYSDKASVLQMHMCSSLHLQAKLEQNK